jgi:hypothetical protein
VRLLPPPPPLVRHVTRNQIHPFLCAGIYLAIEKGNCRNSRRRPIFLFFLTTFLVFIFLFGEKETGDDISFRKFGELSQSQRMKWALLTGCVTTPVPASDWGRTRLARVNLLGRLLDFIKWK